MRARLVCCSLPLLALPFAAQHVQGQIVPRDTTAATATAPADPRETGKRAQAQFENFRRANLRRVSDYGRRINEERVGRFLYTYDEEAPPPPAESQAITDARRRLIDQLALLHDQDPADQWLIGQRIRYLNEAGDDSTALTVARACQAASWWCAALEGFALHALHRYADAEAAYERVLEQFGPSQRCLWRDISLYLDEDTRKAYTRNGCGAPAREAFEDRTWWYARARYGGTGQATGNDSRTEHFARLTYTEFLRDAPSAFNFGFDEDERELLLRFGWPRAWTRGPDIIPPMGSPEPTRASYVGHDPTPSYRFIPPYHVITSPFVSDSLDWAVQRAPVVARYQPAYAKRIVMLEHQQALFRRGDSALVVLAYDVRGQRELAGAALDAALVLTSGRDALSSTRTAQANAPTRGVLLARAAWGPLLMSAEVEAESRSTLVRARYGIRPPYAVGTRVSLSDLLFFTPYEQTPRSVEDVAPHAIATQVVRGNEPLGIYFEAYNTSAEGERMTVSLVVAPETGEGGRGLFGLRGGDAPIRMSVPITSTVGRTTTTQAIEINLSALRRGAYLVNLEIDVAGQYTVRAERRLVVTGP